MSEFFFRGRNVESLTRDELIVLIKWLILRLEKRHTFNDTWTELLRDIWKDDDR